ncbi:MAG TPA: DUF2231 domain-containing protein [Fimbriimonadaceae bacterium]|nr:DUF2231 domain-containing protein [Fimbriimonadaceae bacterium]
MSILKSSGRARLFLGVVLLGLAMPAHARPDIWQKFLAHYHFKAGSDAAKAKCMNCHTDPPVHNAFGRLVKKQLDADGLFAPTPSFWKEVEGADSDGDGYSNGEEAAAGTNPGDPNSHPGEHSGASTTEVQKSTIWDHLFPTHSLHPALVHFPIALFLFGAGLEVVGWRKRRAALRDAAWWCLLFGSLSTLVVVPTGITAFLRNGFHLAGTGLLHPLFAISATITMAIVVLWRRKGKHETLAYFALLLLATLLVSIAGHFGGQLVFGM